MGKVEKVARAICYAAATDHIKERCVFCSEHGCTLWTSFREEARAALRAMGKTSDGE